MEKEFEFRELEGWQWHKTWMIPTITVTVLPENAKSAGNFTFPPNTYITVMCVRPGNRTPEKFFITETGLQGVTSQQAEVGRHVFTGLKFTETSYKQEGSKFNLVVALLYKEEGDMHPSVIDCKISPPIYVDSRFRCSDALKVPVRASVGQGADQLQCVLP